MQETPNGDHMTKFYQPNSDAQAKIYLFKHVMNPHQKIEKVSLDSEGRVDVVGDIYFLDPIQKGTITKQLPMRFGRVEGSFVARGLDLITLEGSPYFVGQTFNVMISKISHMDPPR